MTIKEFVYAAQSEIEVATGSPFKRAHVYETLAAAFGFSSLAALYTDHVFDEGSQHTAAECERHLLGAMRRTLELGYPEAVARVSAPVVSKLVKSGGLSTCSLDRLVSQSRLERGLEDEPSSERLEVQYPEDDAYDDDDRDEEFSGGNDDWSPLLRGGLERAAGAGDHRAHYVLALLAQSSDYDSSEQGSEYWYRMRQSGMKLDGVEAEWADAYAANKRNAALSQQHLEQAAQLGNPHALLDVAEQRDDPECFFRAADVGGNPRRLADLAYRFDQHNVHYWVNAAAEQGDVASMRTLIEQFDDRDLEKCWTWVYFAKLFGTDLTKSDMHAYHDGGLYDGQSYDDDQGGPLYVDGIEGVELEELKPEDDAEARAAAAQLFSQLARTDEA